MSDDAPQPPQHEDDGLALTRKALEREHPEDPQAVKHALEEIKNSPSYKEALKTDGPHGADHMFAMMSLVDNGMNPGLANSLVNSWERQRPENVVTHTVAGPGGEQTVVTEHKDPSAPDDPTKTSKFTRPAEPASPAAEAHHDSPGIATLREALMKGGHFSSDEANAAIKEVRGHSFYQSALAKGPAAEMEACKMAAGVILKNDRNHTFEHTEVEAIVDHAAKAHPVPAAPAAPAMEHHAPAVAAPKHHHAAPGAH
jgi:hypothetical protein